MLVLLPKRFVVVVSISTIRRRFPVCSVLCVHARGLCGFAGGRGSVEWAAMRCGAVVLATIDSCAHQQTYMY